jgi:hypothetical protein
LIHHEAGTPRSTAKRRRAEGSERRASNDGLDSLLDELEQRFDLMRLGRLRAELEEEDERLASEEELLFSCLLDTEGPGPGAAFRSGRGWFGSGTGGGRWPIAGGGFSCSKVT